MKFLSLLGHWLILVTKLVLRELETGKAKNYSVLKSFFQQWIKKIYKTWKNLHVVILFLQQRLSLNPFYVL